MRWDCAELKVSTENGPLGDLFCIANILRVPLSKLKLSTLLKSKMQFNDLLQINTGRFVFQKPVQIGQGGRRSRQP